MTKSYKLEDENHRHENTKQSSQKSDVQREVSHIILCFYVYITKLPKLKENNISFKVDYRKVSNMLKQTSYRKY